MLVIPGTVTSLGTSCSLSSSTLYSVGEYLVLDYGGFINSLLLADYVPSTLDHLFWIRILESFEFLETCGHKW